MGAHGWHRRIRVALVLGRSAGFQTGLGWRVSFRLSSWFARFLWWSRLGHGFRLFHGVAQGEVVLAGDDFASDLPFEFTAGVAGYRAASVGGVFVLREALGAARAGDFGGGRLAPPSTQAVAQSSWHGWMLL